MQPIRHPSRQRGISLVETLTVAGIVAITAGSVLPDFSSLYQRQRLQGVAAQLETELQFARSLAVTERQPVRFSFAAGAGKSCYVIHTGGPGACVCDGDATSCAEDATAIRTVAFEDQRGIRATSNSASFLFDPVKGTVTPTATVTVAKPGGDAIRLVVNVMGRVRACSPTGLSGYKPC